MRQLILTFFFLSFITDLFSQSILEKICIENNDSIRRNLIVKQADSIKNNGDFIKYVDFAKNVIRQSENCNYELSGKMISKFAYDLYYSHKFAEAVEFFSQAKVKLLKENDLLKSAYAASTEGYINYVLGNFDKAAEILSENEKFCISNKLDSALDKTYIGLGFVYRDLKAFDKSLEFFNKALEISRKIKDFQYTYTALNEIGNVYALTNKYEKAISYYMQSITIKEELKDTVALAYSYNDISLIYIQLENYDKALEYLFKSVEICKKKKIEYILIANYLNISDIYIRMNKMLEAEEFLLTAKEYSEKLKVKNEISNVYLSLSKLYSKQNDFKKAYEYHLLHKDYSDSVLNEGVVNKLNELSAKYEYEKNQKEIELLNKDKELKQSEIDQQRIYKNSLIIGVILLILLLAVFINRFLIKRRANVLLSLKNEEIVQQKEEILSQRDEIEAQRDRLVLLNEEVKSQRDFVTLQRDEISLKNKELNDSINYAKRIQKAIFPLEAVLQNQLIDYFIFFKPRDVVSGDFYWFSKINNKLIVMVADCTGHGVPGAFMSILGISALSEIINKYEISTNIILNELRNTVIKTLHQSGKDVFEYHMQDGMDVSLIIIDFDKNICQFSGANNPLYVVSNYELQVSSLEIKTSTPQHLNTLAHQLYEIKGDKMPIGIYSDNSKTFTRHEFEYNSSDRLYLFTDGYCDQFGGDNYKKFKAANFKELLIKSSNLDISEQKDIIESTFYNWKKSTEQIDDVLVMAIELK